MDPMGYNISPTQIWNKGMSLTITTIWGIPSVVDIGRELSWPESIATLKKKQQASGRLGLGKIRDSPQMRVGSN